MIATVTEDGKVQVWPRADSSRFRDTFAEQMSASQRRTQRAIATASSLLGDDDPVTQAGDSPEDRAERMIDAASADGRRLLGLRAADEPQPDRDVDAERRAQDAIALAESLGAVQPAP